jgi:hypothetical protein
MYRVNDSHIRETQIKGCKICLKYIWKNDFKAKEFSEWINGFNKNFEIFEVATQQNSEEFWTAIILSFIDRIMSQQFHKYYISNVLLIYCVP